MSFTLEEAMSLHDRLTPKELEIARLKESEAQLIKERDYWQARALEAEGKKDKERKSKGRFIVISAEKLILPRFQKSVRNAVYFCSPITHTVHTKSSQETTLCGSVRI